MKNLSRIVLSLFMLTLLSCSSDEGSGSGGTEAISNNPVSGKLFGNAFQMNSANSSYIDHPIPV